ncbi:DUF6282 family protein [Pseudonocardia thermophila]|uniref:DUF6282 family protein n=1 Tax=Pseudonocardia thermophila TaxID=1848 RepID=UPI00248DA522|nr:DUF6282 family protein [Pseudonocardia thermophila]
MAGLLIENAVDLHCHFSPDTLGFQATEAGLDLMTGTPVVESARDALAQGQAAVVLKSHSFSSAPLAKVLSEMFPDLRVYGGLCTDYYSGGLNVAAVDAALAMGAKIVWLPTVHSAQDMSTGGGATGFTGGGIAVVGEDGRPNDELKEIFSLISEHDAILATGHVSADEHYAVVKEFAGRGKVLVTHAGEEIAGPKLTRQQAVELADLGATIEFTALCCTDALGFKGKSAAELSTWIAAVGPERCVLSSDLGFLKGVPAPVSGLHNFLERLWKEGVSEVDLSLMASRTPARLLGLELS